MFSYDPSPRPADNLPPTLLPNPVRAVAPSPRRLLSLLLACGCYSVLAALAVASARQVAACGRGPRTVADVTLKDYNPEPPRPQPLPPTAGRALPPGFKVVDRAADPDVVPERVANLRDFQDHSHELQAGTEGTPGLGVLGGTPEVQALAGKGASASQTPIELPESQVQILRQVNPVYPALARLVRAEGVVDLRLTIDAQGIPIEVEVMGGPHPLLINEAVRVARLWRFQPAMVDGVATAAAFRLKVSFRLAR
jgi:TonB family protein